MEHNSIKVDFLKAFSDNYIWILSVDQSNNVIVVDPGESTQVKAYLSANKLNLAAIFITHHHYDHTGGNINLSNLLNLLNDLSFIVSKLKLILYFVSKFFKYCTSCSTTDFFI